MASSKGSDEGPIKLRVANQKAYLWDLSDIQRLRVQHHICGSLHGTLPQVTQQNVFLGLPLVLAPEEVVLLVKHRLAVIVDEPLAHTPPTLAQAQDYAESRETAIRRQQRATYEYEQQKKLEMQDKHRDKIDQKRKLKLEKQQQQQQQRLQEEREGFEVFVPNLEPGQDTTGPPSSAPQSTDTSTTATPAGLPPPPPPPPPPSISSLPYTILIDPSSSSYPWYDPESTTTTTTHSTLGSARRANVWNYPQTKLQEARCRVFEDLWSKGYYMGGGLRFGGDFLIYPGDPLRYHSHFTLTVLSTCVTTIMPLDLVAYGRLATAVKKAHLLASWNPSAAATTRKASSEDDDDDDDGDRNDDGKAEYLSLEWAAFG